MSKTGWKTQDILQLGFQDLLQFDVKQLRAMTQRISDYGNKRIAQLEKADVSKFSPAYGALQQGRTASGKKGRFGVAGIKDKTPKQQRMAYIQEIMRAQSFIESPTSKVKGAQSVKEQFTSKYGEVSDKNYDRLWKVYDEIRKRGYYQNVKSDVAIPLVKQVVSKGGRFNFEKRLERAEEALRRAYEEDEYLQNSRSKDVFDYGSNR